MQDQAMLHLTMSEFFQKSGPPVELLRRSPQIPFPLHTHEFSELVVIFSGQGIHFTDRDEYVVSGGDVFVIEGNQAHGYRNVDDLVLVNILFDPEQLRVPEADLTRIPGYHALVTLEPLLRRSHGFQSRLRLSSSHLDRVKELVDALEEECRYKQPGYQSLATAYFMQIVGYLSRCFTNADGPHAKPLIGLARAVSLLDENLARSVRISELVSASDMSESSLLRAFRGSFGCSPIEYHLRLRLEHAAGLLPGSDLSITVIAGRCGFSDSNYFSRQFRKHYGMSPRDYRRESEAGGRAN